jgi:hypothetical protein
MSLQPSPSPEGATDWWDIADQLTPAQIEELADGKPKSFTVIENGLCSHRLESPEEHASSLLSSARRYARNNLLNALVGPVPLPAGVDWASDWSEGAEDGAEPPFRCVYADRDTAGGRLRLSAAAIQFADGKIDDGIVNAPCIAFIAGGTGVYLSSVEAREAAATLVSLADFLDRVGTRLT